MRAEDWGYRHARPSCCAPTRDPKALVPEVRAAIRRVDPRVAVADVRTMDEIVDDALRQQRISAVLIAASRSARCCSRRWGCSASFRTR